jgi:uncharacterized LabA/DUF88 family protein
MNQIGTSKLEKIYIAVDVSNLYLSCKEMYGHRAKIDFKALSQFFNTNPEQVESDAMLVAYTIGNLDNNQTRFHNTLKKFGYNVKHRPITFPKGKDKPFGTDWGIGIAIDALQFIDLYDTFVLISGNGDYDLLLKYLHERGKHTVVVSFAHTKSKLLDSDESYYLDDSFLFNKESLNV